MIPLLYIDPGTGSILFSIVLGIITTLYFVIKTAFIKLKVIIHKDKIAAVSTIPIVIYSEGKQYWNVFAPICDAFEQNHRNVVFYTSAEDDPVFGYNYNYVKPQYIGSGNKAFARLNMLDADVCLMTTPGLDVYQLKRSKKVKHYSHILHAVDDATSYRLFGLDYFDSVLLSGEYQKDGIRMLEKLRNIKPKELYIVGCTYLDVLQEKIKTLPSKQDTFTVLLAPSWGTNGILSKYGEKLTTPLVETGWRIIIRPHPQSKISELEVLNYLEDKYKTYNNISWDYTPDNIYSLSQADVMISDFSSVIFDYCFLFDKPFLYCNNEFDHRSYDSGDLTTEPWKFSILREIGIELKREDFANIKDLIQKTVKDVLLKESRIKAKECAWQNEGKAGMLVYDFLLKKVESFKTKR